MKQSPIPVGITEGFKKAASVITQGYACVGVPGIWNWIDRDAEKFINFKGDELTALESKQELTDSQRHKLRKGKMEKLYGVEADEELIKQDDDGLYPHLSLLFWLTVGRDDVGEVDQAKAENYTEKTEGKGYEPDFNRTQNTAKVQLLEILKIKDFLAMENEEISNDSPAVQAWWQHIQELMANYYNTKAAIKRFLGITLSEQETPLRNLGKFLERVGYRLINTSLISLLKR